MKTARTNRIGRLAGLATMAAAASLVLAACTVEISTPDARDVTNLSNDEDYRSAMTPVRINLAPGESWSRTYNFGSARGNAVFVVVSAGDLYLESIAGRVEASSSVSTYFAEGRDGIVDLADRDDGLTALEVPSGDVSDATECIGACIIVRDDTTSAIRFTDKRVVVENPFSDDRNIDVYVFSRDLDDVTEPANDQDSGADLLDGSMYGALETLGDVDWFEVDFRSNVTVYAPTVPADDPFPEDYLRLLVEWHDDAGLRETRRIDPDGSATFDNVQAGDYIRVSAAGGRAGPASATLYEVVPTGIVGVSFPD